MIHYQVIGRGSARLNNFTGTCVYDLKEAIKAKEQLPSPASLLNLSIRKKSSEEIEDLEELEDLAINEVFRFTTFCSTDFRVTPIHDFLRFNWRIDCD